MQNKEIQRLIDDLLFVKKAINKNASILRLIDAGNALSRVIFYSGLATIFISLTTYFLIEHYGSFPQIPPLFRGGIFTFIAALVAITAFAKAKSITQANTGPANLTVRRLLREIYSPQTMHTMIPFIIALITISIFLVINGYTLYLVPVLSILMGSLCLAYVNVFQLKELIVAGDWMLATGLISLFLAPSLHPLLVLSFTFGLGLCVIYPANKIMERRR